MCWDRIAGSEFHNLKHNCLLGTKGPLAQMLPAVRDPSRPFAADGSRFNAGCCVRKRPRKSLGRHVAAYKQALEHRIGPRAILVLGTTD